MLTITVEELAYKALSTNSNVLSLLANGVDSIFTGKAPDIKNFPGLVISEISDIPIDYADNELITHQSTIRISIMVKRGQSLKPIIKAVYNCMKVNEFYWSQSFDYEEDDYSSKIMQFNYKEFIEEE